MRTIVVYKFSCQIYRLDGQISNYSKTFKSKFITSLSELEKYLKECETRRLDLDDVEIWSAAYLPSAGSVNMPGIYEGRVDFTNVRVKLISTKEPLMGCGKLPDWLRNQKSLYAIDDRDDNLCVWRCLAIFHRINNGHKRPAHKTTKEALKLARDYYENQKLGIKEVRGTKLIDFENIAKIHNLNIRLYEPKENQKTVWRLVYGKNQFKQDLPSIDIGLYEGHCFYIRDIESLSKHWECQGCNQRFTKHWNYDRHVIENLCTGGKPK